MGASYKFKCSNCKYSFNTSGPWEFYRDKKGKIKPYGHPEPMSNEAVKMGISRFFGELYCVKCDKIYEVILVDYDNPDKNPVSAWRKAAIQKSTHLFVECSECESTEMVFTPYLENREKIIIPCPMCKKGEIIGEMEWIY